MSKIRVAGEFSENFFWREIEEFAIESESQRASHVSTVLLLGKRE